MPNLLLIESSPMSTSVSTALSRKYTAEWQAKHPEGTIVTHNVSHENVPYVTETWVGAVFTPPEQLTPGQRELLALSDNFIAEVVAADTIVIAAPMHNFGIPAALKAWIDLIVRKGKTFSYGPEGPKGLLDPSKKALLVVSRGGSYRSDSPYAILDQQEPYLRTIFGFIGLTNLTFIYVENQSRGPEAAAVAVKTGSDALLAHA